MTDPTPNGQTWVCRSVHTGVRCTNEMQRLVRLSAHKECGPVPPAPSSDEPEPWRCVKPGDGDCGPLDMPNPDHERCGPAPSSDTPSDERCGHGITLAQVTERCAECGTVVAQGPAPMVPLDVTALPEWEALRTALEIIDGEPPWPPDVEVAARALLAAADRKLPGRAMAFAEVRNDQIREGDLLANHATITVHRVGPCDVEWGGRTYELAEGEVFIGCGDGNPHGFAVTRCDALGSHVVGRLAADRGEPTP